MESQQKPFLLFVGDHRRNLVVVDATTRSDVEVEVLRASSVAEAHLVLDAQAEADENPTGRDIDRDLAEYRRLSSATQSTRITAALARSGALSLTSTDDYARLVDDYYDLIEPALQAGEAGPGREPLREIAARVGSLGGGPRDLLDIHLAALERVHSNNGDSTSHFVVSEARLVALELMGLLVDYYRVGVHRVARRGNYHE